MTLTLQTDEGTVVLDFTRDDFVAAEMVERLERLLLAAGYVFDGHLAIVEDE